MAFRAYDPEVRLALSSDRTKEPDAVPVRRRRSVTMTWDAIGLFMIISDLSWQPGNNSPLSE
jgi:hypothetical protein